MINEIKTVHSEHSRRMVLCLVRAVFVLIKLDRLMTNGFSSVLLPAKWEKGKSFYAVIAISFWRRGNHLFWASL
jgi:hypothetical protein